MECAFPFFKKYILVEILFKEIGSIVSSFMKVIIVENVDLL